ncbi:MAG: heme lyase CcmF/NrfE family subunit [Candidatus Eisenbacteria bacterium]|nr:heme lyase CcmF/NrfE family subunit [Candidatus Eisenbacteria bacterium]
MNELGSIAVVALWPVTLFGAAASWIGAFRRNGPTNAAGARSLPVAAALATLAVAALAALFLTDDFRNGYVAGHSNAALPLPYKAAALWAGQEGSLLFWNWLLLLFGAAAARSARKRHPDLAPWTTAILLTGCFFFSHLNLFAVNPFRTLVAAGPAGPVPFTPPDGMGLNPLLQHPVMVIHPPLLYIGYVGFSVPFALALAALIARPAGSAWLRTVRLWTLFSWTALTAGILLGMRWAYVELGWGGYWSWDPVENASLLPWFTATAFLHSVVVQERRAMFKTWNAALLALTYFLCVFGTFLTRSGIVSSVHAFARSPVGGPFAVYLIAGAALTLLLIVARRRYLAGEAPIDGLLSRESAFLLNNIVLLVACFAVLWGTFYPVLSEAMGGGEVSVGAEYYNRVNVPLGLFLLALAGAAPAFVWRRSDPRRAGRVLAAPAAAAILSIVALRVSGVIDPRALVAVAIVLFALLSAALDIGRGAAARARRLGVPLFRALPGLVPARPRRYGGILAHLGVALLFLGLAGAAFNRSAQAELAIGDALSLGGTRFRLERMEEGETENFDLFRCEISSWEGGKRTGFFRPEIRRYRAGGQTTSEIEIRSDFRRDLYVVFASVGPNDGAVVQVYENPLVRWIWIGGVLIVAGALLALAPPAGRRTKR